MSENDTGATGPGTEEEPVNGPDNANNGGSGDQPEEETFSREYVERLRSEAAEQRKKAERADVLEQRLLDAAIREGATGVLEDPSDLQVEADDVKDQDGYVSVEKVRKAAQALAELKPHLAKRKPPSGDVGQGVKPEGRGDPHDKLAHMLKRSVGV